MAVTVIGDNTGDDYAGTEDCEIWEAIPDSSTGSKIAPEISSYGTGDFRNLLISFSGLSNIPSGDVISAASIYLYKTGGRTTAGVEVLVRRALRAWVDGSATWNDYDGTNPWTTGGGTSQGNDVATTLTENFDGPTVNGYFSVSSAQMATDYQGFHDGTYSNYGHLFYRDPATTPDSWYLAIVGETSTDGQRPYLSVTHAAGGGATIPVFINHFRNQGIM